jgi:hypothetical protein
MSGMRFRAGLLLIITLPAFASPVKSGSSSYMSGDRLLTLQDAQRLLLEDRFAAVDSICEGHISEYPDDPAGYLFQAAALLGQMVDREENLHESRFKQLLSVVDSLTSVDIDSTDRRKRGWYLLFEGHANAYRSLWEARFGSFLAAIKGGLAARKAYEKGLEFDSTLYDLYFGLGSYHYWKSARAGLLGVIGLFRNEKQKGIDELYLAVDSSVLSRDAARAALVWVWLDRDEFDSVIAITDNLLRAYPQGKSWMWPRAQAYFRSERYQHALMTYRKLRELISREPGNYINVVECDYRIARCLELMDQDDKARRHSRVVETYVDKLPRSTRKQLRTEILHLLRSAGNSRSLY